jgi:DNA mismatch repair protein MutL
MQSIQILSPVVAEQIAAGEVIDRPAAVVKELIENAIDAGAAEIRVEVRGGGLRSIQVADDGCGIPGDELELAFRRHATSKLRDLADLERVESFGFRGEALASIAAVAEVTAISAVEGRSAVRCSFRAGRPLERGPAARARGTTITVRDLFSQMPARLKFMRGPRAESIQIGAVVRRCALACPHLRLSLVLEGHYAFRSVGGSLHDALALVYGDVAADGFVHFGPSTVEGVSILGLISNPAVTRSTRGQVSLYVNGRYVRPRTLLTAVEDGYRPFLPRGRHPLAAVLLTVPTADLDVNVHPAKLDVRLRAEAAVANVLRETVGSAYGAHPRVPIESAGLALSGRQRTLGISRRLREDRVSLGAWGDGVELPAGDLLPSLRLVGQVANALIVAEGPSGCYLIDQHRAHERIIYERLLDEGRAQQQALIEPAVLELQESAARRLVTRLSSLESLGFACEQFGPQSFIVRATPAGEGLEAIAALLAEVLAEASVDRDDWRQGLLASIACRSALRKGRPLGMAEARDLVARLGTVSSPAACPHGSPILLHLSDRFLTRQFDWS